MKIDGKIIKFVRNANGLEQKQLAEMLGVSQSVISFVETGKREPSENLSAKFKETFELSDIDLLNLINAIGRQNSFKV